MLIHHRVVLVHLRAGVVELDMLASGIGHARFNLGVMPILEEELPNLEGMCVLAESLPDLGRDAVGGSAPTQRR